MSFFNKLFSIENQRARIIIYCCFFKFSFKKSDDCNDEISKDLDKQLKQDTLCFHKIIQRIKNKKKCRVVFYVFEISKWKTNSLYNLMKNDERFEPIIVLGFTPGRTTFYSHEEKEERITKQIQYFEAKGFDVKCSYNLKRNKQISLSSFKPDIVFYQQHVGNCAQNDVERVKRYALCCYVPYNVPNYINLEYDYDSFCSQLFRFYTLNNQLKRHYETLNSSINNIYAVGHTALDEFYLDKNTSNNEKYVIYAPHFSIMHPNVKNKFYYSTFNFYGEMILEFAKAHPEINWIFKPHPNLKESLKKMNVLKEYIDDYYNEWANIGTVCEDSDYYKYFINSKAMITDCGSFLTEYFCTGKPLLHLIHPFSINKPSKAMKPMFESFYKIHDKNELLIELERIILHGNDYKKEEREIAFKQLQFTNQYAAKNIMEDLTNVLWGEES